MNEWYEWANALETDSPPLDEVSRVRIEQKVRAALPRGRKRRWAAAVIAAALVLSACGYAAVTGQFSQWFWNKAADSQTPEASEDLLASMGTVIGQSQTADGVTVVLNGAIWDGKDLMLSLSLEGEALPSSYWSSVKFEDSWLTPSRAQTKAALQTSFPYMSEEELNTYLDQYLETSRYFGGVSAAYFYNRQTSAYEMQIESSIYTSGDSQELTLHLENLDVSGDILQGPFEFTFTVDLHAVKQVYFGTVDLEPAESDPIRVTKVSLTPLRVSVSYTGCEPLELDANGSPIGKGDPSALSIEALRVNGEEVTGFSSERSSRWENGPDGSWGGAVSCGPFHRVIDPAAVEAIQINGTWLELDQMDLDQAESAG